MIRSPCPEPPAHTRHQCPVLRAFLEAHPVSRPLEPVFRPSSLLRIQQARADIHNTRSIITMPEDRCAAIAAELTVSPFGMRVSLQGPHLVVHFLSVELSNVGFRDKGPGLDIISRGEAARVASASTGEVFGAVGTKPPGKVRAGLGRL